MNEYKLATGIVIKNNLGEILFLKRIKNGLWTIPGGKVEDGEDILICAIRELEEETGINNINLDFYMETQSFTDNQNWKEIIYIGKIKNSNIAINKEPKNFSEIKFFNLNNLPELSKIAGYDHVIIERLKNENNI